MDNLPPLQAVIQQFPETVPITDPGSELRKRLSRSGFLDEVEPGQRVALALGSRGINGRVEMVRAMVEAVAERGGEAFIIPAMGSHGGATAGGQKAMLESLGISEESCGARIVSSMEVAVLGRGTEAGARVITSVDALKADWVIPLIRVKPHTSFQGEIESGFMKMLVVGLGKEEGAREFHLHGMRSPFPGFMIELARGIMNNLRFLAGVAVVEDARGRTVRLEVVGPERFESTDRELLSYYRSIAPELPFEDADMLIVERMGKDISGTGVDTNVIRRSRHQLRADPTRLGISRIWARGLTTETKGNANGVGLCDFVSRRLLDDLNLEVTIKNALTSLAPEHGFLPPALEPEKRILFEAMRTAGVVEIPKARIAWIMDTGSLDRLLVSPSLCKTLKPAARLHPENRNTPFKFGKDSNLASFEQHWLEATGGG